MGLSNKLVATGIAAGAALVYYAHRRRARTGESYVSILRQLPSDAQRWVVDAQRKATLALEDGKSAARQREDELTRRLTAGSAPATEG
jgi:hypothetical protein